LSVNENEVCALIGPNGAGKSTFVGLVCGRILPTRGKVLFDGQDISTLPAHARIRLGVAYTFQITSVFANLPVLENVSLAARRALASSNAGLRNRKRAVHERVIMDEPTQGLALDEIERFKELLTRLSSSTTILLIEHNMDVVMDTANRIAVLDAGELIGDGTPAEVRSDPRVQASYLGTQTDEAPP